MVIFDQSKLLNKVSHINVCGTYIKLMYVEFFTFKQSCLKKTRTSNVMRYRYRLKPVFI